MAKSRFVNQKLGKRVSRKFDLLKSELVGRGNRKHPPRRANSPFLEKVSLRSKP
jgi:hypothetical protein